MQKQVVVWRRSLLSFLNGETTSIEAIEPSAIEVPGSGVVLDLIEITLTIPEGAPLSDHAFANASQIEAAPPSEVEVTPDWDTI